MTLFRKPKCPGDVTDAQRGFHAYARIGETRTCHVFECRHLECRRRIAVNRETGHKREVRPIRA